MKKEVILVPQGKCPMDVLAEMGEKTKNAWIFLHENAYQHLMKSKGAQVYTKNTENCNKITLIKWEATEDFPETSVCIEEPHAKGWEKLLQFTQKISLMNFLRMIRKTSSSWKWKSNLSQIKTQKKSNFIFWVLFYYIYYFFNWATVTPISPSPKVPNLKSFTWGCFFKNVWMPCLNFPVPLPCTILIVFKLVK